MWTDTSWYPAGETVTDEYGSYDFSDPENDKYYMEFDGRDAGWNKFYYTDAIMSINAEALTVEAPDMTEPTPVYLQPGGLISGTVEECENNALEGVTVTIYRILFPGMPWMFERRSVTDENGRYEANGLPDGLKSGQYAIIIDGAEKGLEDVKRMTPIPVPATLTVIA